MTGIEQNKRIGCILKISTRKTFHIISSPFKTPLHTAIPNPKLQKAISKINMINPQIVILIFLVIKYIIKVDRPAYIIPKIKNQKK